MDPILASITMFAGNFAPRGWALCQGQLLPISQNTALFSLLGTIYGGDGKVTFALPDLRGRAAIGFGQSPGGSNYSIGETGGVESTTLLLNQVPAHAHPAVVKITSKAAASSDAGSPISKVYSTPSSGNLFYSTSPSAKMQSYTATLNTGPTGNGLPFSNLHPLLAINFIIALSGVFPARS